MTRLGVAAALVYGRRVAGDVAVAGGEVTGVGLLPAGRTGLAVPGFVDLQVNGAAGVEFLVAEPADHARMAAALAATGVTAYRPTLVSAPREVTVAALGSLAAAAPGAALGAHLEGPFLSPRWPGAHPPEYLRAPDGSLLTALLEAGPVGAMTLAPELPGADELMDALRARGVVVHLGHTDADTAAAHAAFARGARALTHAFNAHRRFHHRDPGPVGVALARDDVIVTAILDGVHLAPEVASLLWSAAGPRLALVSDRTEASLAGRAVTVRDGAPRLPDGGPAGSVLTMDAAVRALVALGAPVAAAVGAATGVPAQLVSERPVGRLAPGGPADLAVLDDDLEIARTVVSGVEVFAR